MLYLVLTFQTILEALIIAIIILTIIFVVGNIIQDVKTYYKKWKIKKHNRRWEKEREEFIQWQRKRELERKLRKEEMRKYPLFFLKEGIVDGNS